MDHTYVDELLDDDEEIYREKVGCNIYCILYIVHFIVMLHVQILFFTDYPSSLLI